MSKNAKANSTAVIYVRVPDYVKEIIDEIAGEYSVTIAEIVRRSVFYYLEEKMDYDISAKLP